MGRKIPAKKHRGVKDPAQQQAKRLQSLKGKINAPPKDPDEQPVPRSLTELFAFQDQKDNKQNDNVRRKKPKRFGHDDSHENTSFRAKNPITKMKKLPGESGRSFSLRINSAVKALHGIEDAQDYPLDLEEDEDMKGERMDAQRRRRERKRRAGGKGAAGGAAEPALSRNQRLALKKKAKKERDAEVAKEEKREVVYERVGFGEVAHAPPSLTFKARKAEGAKGPGAPRPGRRDLLLNKLLEAPAPPPGAKPRARALPVAERLRRERARQDAVDAYRTLKANALKKPKIT